MKHSFFLTFILFLFLINATYSQPGLKYKKQSDEEISEIKDKLLLLQGKKSRVNDSLRLELLNNLSVLYIKKSKDTALYYAQTALKEAKAIDLKNLIAVSLYNTAFIYEFYKQPDLAEENYLAWMEVRKNENDDEYRWALHELRRFYITYKKEDKLSKIQDEWMIVLDRQLDKGEITPWYDHEYATPEQSYKYSTLPVCEDLVAGGYFFIAEKSFLHMLEKCQDCFDWSSDGTPYWGGQYKMLLDKDTASLSILYDHWHKTVQKYPQGKEQAVNNFTRVSVFYVDPYYKMDKYFDKYYRLLLNYTYEFGGDQAAYEMLKESSGVGCAYIVKIKLNLLLMQSCIKVKDNERLDRKYKETDRLITEYLGKKFPKKPLGIAILAAKDECSNAKYKKWCDKKLVELNK